MSSFDFSMMFSSDESWLEEYQSTLRTCGFTDPCMFRSRVPRPSTRALSLQELRLTSPLPYDQPLDARLRGWSDLPTPPRGRSELGRLSSGFGCDSWQTTASTNTPVGNWMSADSLSHASTPSNLNLSSTFDLACSLIDHPGLPTTNEDEPTNNFDGGLSSLDDNTSGVLNSLLADPTWMHTLDALTDPATSGSDWAEVPLFDHPNYPLDEHDEPPLVSAAKRHKKLGSVRLFVGRIPKSLRGRDLRELFQQYGPVVDCNIICDRTTGESRGCGFIRMADLVSACRAVSSVHQKVSVCSEIGPLQVKFASGELKRLRLPEVFQPGGDCVKVFFGNLSSTTNENILTGLAREFGQVEEVCILPTTRGGSRPSRCSGFVTFQVLTDALRCIKALDKRVISKLNPQKAVEVRLAESKAKRARRLAETKRVEQDNVKHCED